ncbi:hypothetical protein QR98_0046620, partial [Sarcoptes scabiei]
MTKIESLEIIGSSFISFFLFLFSTVRPINVKIVSKSHLIKSSFSSASSSSTNAKELDSKLPFVLSAGSKAEFQCESRLKFHGGLVRNDSAPISMTTSMMMATQPSRPLF